MVRPRSATPLSPVQIRLAPLIESLKTVCFQAFLFCILQFYFMATKEGMLIIKLFDEIYPENGISDVKRLTLLCGKIADGENNINLIII